MANCSLYKPIKQDKDNCCNCHNWSGIKCKQEDRLINYKTDINHEPVYNVRRGVCGVIR